MTRKVTQIDPTKDRIQFSFISDRGLFESFIYRYMHTLTQCCWFVVFFFKLFFFYLLYFNYLRILLVSQEHKPAMEPAFL